MSYLALLVALASGLGSWLAHARAARRLARHEEEAGKHRCNAVGPYAGLTCVLPAGHGGPKHRNQNGWTWIRAQ